MNRQDDRVESAERGRRAQISHSSSSILRRNLLSRYSSSQIVAMMQAAESWHRYNHVAYTEILPCFPSGMCFLASTDAYCHKNLQAPMPSYRRRQRGQQRGVEAQYHP
jgi:hypothetical protein